MPPKPFVKIRKFDLDGEFCVYEWSTRLDLPSPLDNFQIIILEAKALADISAKISGAPVEMETQR